MAKHRLRVCIGHNEDGTAIVKQVSGNSESDLADKVVKAILASERRDEFVGTTPSKVIPVITSKQSIEFNEYVRNWYPKFRGTATTSPKTIASDKSLLRKHIYAFFDGKTLNELTASDIQTFLNERDYLAKGTLKTILGIVRQALDMAVDDGLIVRNPAASKKIKLPSERKTERQALTTEQLFTVLSGVDHLEPGNDRRYMGLLLLTGMRKGEVLGLKWEDIDFDCNTIHIQRQVVYTSNQPIIKTPKSQQSNRVIGIEQQLIKLLEPLGTSGFIISTDCGAPITLQAEKRMKERISRKINMFGATPHVFRHSYLSLLSTAGVEPKTIQAIAGHSDIKITMERYVHRDQRRMIEAAQVGEKYLAQHGNAQNFVHHEGQMLRLDVPS